jgi:hypothetical protein
MPLAQAANAQTPGKIMKIRHSVLALPLALSLAVSLAASPLALSTATAAGRDDRLSYPVADVLNSPELKARLPDVKFYFGSQRASVSKSLGETHTNKKTNAFNKTDKVACDWAMLSALIAIGEDAKRRGGNAVVGIESNYKGERTSSNDSYVCGAGNLMAGVALVGTVATVR